MGLKALCTFLTMNNLLDEALHADEPLSLTDEELQELMSQVEVKVAQKLKERDKQLLEVQKTMAGFMQSVRVLSNATRDVVKKRSPQQNASNYTSPYRQQPRPKNKSRSTTHFSSSRTLRARESPEVQISELNDEFFCEDY